MFYYNLKLFLLSFSRYVSTKYINDCIEHNKQLNLEDYKLDSSGAKKYSTRVGNNNKPSYTALLGGINTLQHLVLLISKYSLFYIRNKQ